MQRKVLEISFALLQCFETEPRLLSITAIGKVPTLGWKSACLVPYEYPSSPEDGIYHFDFIAEAPDTVAPEIANSVVAHFSWSPQWETFAGVVIHSSENEKQVKKGSKDYSLARA